MANIFIRLIIFSSVIFPVSDLSAAAQPLQGHAEESNVPMRIQRPVGDTSNLSIQGNTNQDVTSPQSSLVKVDQFNVQIPMTQVPSGNKQLAGDAASGQSEYWVSWDVWRHRVADAVWAPIKSQQITMWGRTRVDYNVTRDHHIQILSVTTPDPTGESGRILQAAIMRLDGDPVLTFPIGSKQVIHQNFNMEIGLPIPSRTRRTIYLPGGSEHVVNQW